MKYIYILTIVSLFLVTSCSKSDGYIETKSNDSLFSLLLPPDMHKLEGLNSDAQMQYGSLDKNLTVIAIKDNINNYNELVDSIVANTPDSANFNLAHGFIGYYSLVLFNLKDNASKFKLVENYDTIINSLNTKFYSYNAIYDTDKSFVTLAIYQGKENYYQIFSMTPTNKSDENINIMKKIIFSFKEQ
ncbi:MAG: hypothetical protein MJ211_03755 [Bacteroidales bacterium]|nr:hypothetical protein [Bacteroidales bacterium]